MILKRKNKETNSHIASPWIFFVEAYLYRKVGMRLVIHALDCLSVWPWEWFLLFEMKKILCECLKIANVFLKKPLFSWHRPLDDLRWHREKEKKKTENEKKKESWLKLLNLFLSFSVYHASTAMERWRTSRFEKRKKTNFFKANRIFFLFIRVLCVSCLSIEMMKSNEKLIKTKEIRLSKRIDMWVAIVATIDPSPMESVLHRATHQRLFPKLSNNRVCSNRDHE